MKERERKNKHLSHSPTSNKSKQLTLTSQWTQSCLPWSGGSPGCGDQASNTAWPASECPINSACPENSMQNEHGCVTWFVFTLANSQNKMETQGFCFKMFYIFFIQNNSFSTAALLSITRSRNSKCQHTATSLSRKRTVGNQELHRLYEKNGKCFVSYLFVQHVHQIVQHLNLSHTWSKDRKRHQMSPNRHVNFPEQAWCFDLMHYPALKLSPEHCPVTSSSDRTPCAIGKYYFPHEPFGRVEKQSEIKFLHGNNFSPQHQRRLHRQNNKHHIAVLNIRAATAQSAERHRLSHSLPPRWYSVQWHDRNGYRSHTTLLFTWNLYRVTFQTRYGQTFGLFLLR